MMWSMFSSLAYLYMVASWGGYAFIINIIPILVVSLLVIIFFELQSSSC